MNTDMEHLRGAPDGLSIAEQAEYMQAEHQRRVARIFTMERVRYGILAAAVIGPLLLSFLLVWIRK